MIANSIPAQLVATRMCVALPRARACPCHAHVHGRSRRTRAWQGHVRARGHTKRMRVATNRAVILLAIMRPGQLKSGDLLGCY